MRSTRLAALAALSITAASSAAAAQSAAPLSIDSAPAVQARETIPGSSELVGATAWILAAIGLGLIVWGIVELTDDSDSP